MGGVRVDRVGVVVVWVWVCWGGVVGMGRSGSEMVEVGRGGGGVGGVVGRSGAVGMRGRAEVGDRTRLVGVGWEQRRTQGGASWLRRERARLET